MNNTNTCYQCQTIKDIVLIELNKPYGITAARDLAGDHEVFFVEQRGMVSIYDLLYFQHRNNFMSPLFYKGYESDQVQKKI